MDNSYKPNPKPLRLFYFWTGVIATFLYRAIIVLNYYSATWVKVFWYLGTIGFIIYFAHRYSISNKRAKLISERQLITKVGQMSEFNADDREAISYILNTLVSTKEKWNYIAIFVLSGIALVIGIIMDIIAR